MSQPTPPQPGPGAQPGGTRTDAGGTYGDFVPSPDPAPARRDPSKGAEMERDSMPPDADFSQPPPHADSATPQSPPKPPAKP